MATIAANQVNGINLDTLQETVSAVKAKPELAKCKFRARNAWVGSTRNRSAISDFYGAGQEMQHNQTFRLDNDEPPVLAGEDRAPNPVEHLLNALAGCLTTSMVAHAAVRGIRIDELESELEGDIDLRGFLGLDASVPKGFSNIRVKFKAKTDANNLEQLRRLADFSPVYNTLTKGANVQVDVQPKA